MHSYGLNIFAAARAIDEPGATNDITAATFYMGKPQVNEIPVWNISRASASDGTDNTQCSSQASDTPPHVTTAAVIPSGAAVPLAALTKPQLECISMLQACTCTHQVAFVEEQQHVLVARVLTQVLLQVPAARPLRVPGIQHLRSRDRNCLGMLQSNGLCKRN